MTKKERAKKLKEILAEFLMPQPGNGEIFVEVQALSANRLLVEVLKDNPPNRQVFISVEFKGPNVVSNIFEQLTKED